MNFPSIGQFRNVINQVRYHTQVVGEDENGEPIYDRQRYLPTLRARGTVKVHGTNAGVALVDGELRCYSRTREITPENDNVGFARYVHDNEDAFRNLFDLIDEDVTIYGEWCGKGIQKGVAVCDLDRMFIIFAIKLANGNWLDFSDLDISSDARIFSIFQFPTFDIDIDFEHPGEVKDEIARLTLAVEERCPVGAHFGVEGTGEGIVWTIPALQGSRYWFKTKGKKHRVTAHRQVVEIDPERSNNIREFVDATVTQQRLEQGVEALKEGGSTISHLMTREFLIWVAEDVLKEEGDRMEASNLEKKDVTRAISQKARDWWFKHLDHLALNGLR